MCPGQVSGSASGTSYCQSSSNGSRILFKIKLYAASGRARARQEILATHTLTQGYRATATKTHIWIHLLEPTHRPTDRPLPTFRILAGESESVECEPHANNADTCTFSRILGPSASYVLGRALLRYSLHLRWTTLDTGHSYSHGYSFGYCLC